MQRVQTPTFFVFTPINNYIKNPDASGRHMRGVHWSNRNALTLMENKFALCLKFRQSDLQNFSEMDYLSFE